MGAQGESQQIIHRLNLGTCVRATSRRLFGILARPEGAWQRGQVKPLEQEYFLIHYIFDRETGYPSVNEK
jgi:hypothetical protein